MLRFFLFFIACLFGSATITAQTYQVKGVVSDAETSDPLIGATVVLDGTNLYASTGLDGSFVIKQVSAGDYKLKVSYVSFETYTQNISVKANIDLKVRLKYAQELLNEVEVVARRDESSEQSARAAEKMSMSVLNIISAKEIEVSPDITVANVVQRVSGVSLERNSNGDGQYAIVRGMDKRYNYTLVNGIKIPSPDPKNRYVPLDIFPSDLLERLEVTKALTPNMEGDAIGGVIDMKMKSAPDRFTLNFNVGTGYNHMFFNQKYRAFNRNNTSDFSPRILNGNSFQAQTSDFDLNNLDFYDRTPPLNQVYGLSIGNRFYGGKLGVLVAGSYQNTFRGANSLFMTTFVDQATNTPYYEIVQDRQFSAQQARTGAHAKIDFEPNKYNKFDLYLASIALNDFETRTRTDTILKIGRGQGPGTGRIELRERSRQRYQRIHNATLQGRHQISNKFNADWSAVYSLATNDDPDMAEIKFITATTRNNQGQIVQDPIMYDTDFNRRWTNNTDNDLAGYANLNYSPGFSSIPVDFSTGGMVRFKNRENNFDQYLFRASPIMQQWSGSIHDGSWNLFNSIGTPTDPLNYTSAENITAVYAMFKLNYEKLEVLGGARYESTYFEWESAAPVTVRGRTGNLNYTDILPSLHFKYMPKKDQNIRLSYFSSISRPSFFEVIPYEINEDDFRERGNPFLNRTRANNLDFRYEKFSNVLDKFMVGVFYKNILDPIETALVIQGQNVFLQPNNFGTATNMGLEVDFVKYIRNFGLRFFYTYTNSEITTSKIVRFRNDAGNLTSREENQTRPLQGQSAHISNVSFLYKNTKKGIDTQLSMVYTGSRIISVSPYLDNDIWQRGFVQLDLSVEKNVGKQFVLYAKINNLLDTPLRADILQPNIFNPEQAPYIDSQNSVLVREDFYMQTYLFGVRYRFVKN